MGASLRERSEGVTEARLHLDGLATPILTRVTRHGPTGMTVEQTLPFLRLHTLVRDDADQHAHIESVSMVVQEGVPRLVLDLAYDGGIEEASTGEPAEPRAAHAGVVRPRARREATTPFEIPAPELAPKERPAVREPTLSFTTPTARGDEPAHGLAGEQLTLEEQLLLERSMKHKLQAHWARIEPRARATVRALRAAGLRTWVVLAPLLAAAAHRAMVAARAGVAKLRASRA